MTHNYKGKRIKLRKQATHRDVYGNLYKFVNGKLFQYNEVYIYRIIDYPVYTLVKEVYDIELFEI